MRILIPMAGAGARFLEAGYKLNKAQLPMKYRKTGEIVPMVVASVLDLPGILPDGSNIIFVMRDFHIEQHVDETIKEHFPGAQFIVVDHLTEGQACTCLLAQKYINNDEELLIAACDNGIEFSLDDFVCKSKKYDSLVFTYRHNTIVTENPNAYGWIMVGDNEEVTGVSVKKAISDNPMNDHAIVATFWFRKGKYFVEAAEKMISENDRVNNEFYADQVIKHLLDIKYKVGVFEVKRFLNFGTPKLYENYNKTLEHFEKFMKWRDEENGISFGD